MFFSWPTHVKRADITTDAESPYSSQVDSILIGVIGASMWQLLFIFVLFLHGELESAMFATASALDSAVSNPELVVRIRIAITASAVATTASSFPGTVCDKRFMHVPPGVRSPQFESSHENSLRTFIVLLPPVALKKINLFMKARLLFGAYTRLPLSRVFLERYFHLNDLPQLLFNTEKLEERIVSFVFAHFVHFEKRMMQSISLE
jgi:hypothetical protein